MRQPAGPLGLAGTQPHVPVRVRISLPKKAALYTMKFPFLQILARSVPRRRAPEHHDIMQYPEPATPTGSPTAQAVSRQDARGAGRNARRRAPGGRGARHDRRRTSCPASPPTSSTGSATTTSSTCSRPIPATARLPRLPEDRSAPRSTTSSATASRATGGSSRATSSTSTSPSSRTASTATPAACIYVGKPPPHAQRLVET